MGQGQKLYLWRVSGRGWIPEDLSALVLVLNRMGKEPQRKRIGASGKNRTSDQGLMSPLLYR